MTFTSRRSDGPGQDPVKPESAGFVPIPGKTRGFLADTSLRSPSDTLGWNVDRLRPFGRNRRESHLLDLPAAESIRAGSAIGFRQLTADFDSMYVFTASSLVIAHNSNPSRRWSGTVGRIAPGD